MGKDKVQKKPVVVASSSGSESDSSDAKPAQKRSRAASNVSAASKGSANKAQKKTEKAVVPQKKQKVESSSGSDSSEDDKLASAGSGSDSGSDDKEEAKVGETPVATEDAGAVDAEHVGKLELFVQGLAFETDEDGLRGLFEPFGELSKCKLLMGMGRSKGKAFIEYTDHKHAATALNATNQKDLDGRTIWVEWSGQAAGGYKPQEGADGVPGEANTVFVGNLGFRTEQWAIEEFFKSCGTINSVRIATGDDGRPRGFAHVEFDGNAAALEAMKLAGQEIDGRAIRLDLSVSRRGGGGGGRGGGRGGFGGGRGGDRGGRGGGFRGGGRGGDRGGGFRGGGRGGDRGGRGGGFRGGGRGGDRGGSRGSYGGGRGGDRY